MAFEDISSRHLLPQKPDFELRKPAADKHREKYLSCSVVTISSRIGAFQYDNLLDNVCVKSDSRNLQTTHLKVCLSDGFALSTSCHIKERLNFIRDVYIRLNPIVVESAEVLDLFTVWFFYDIICYRVISLSKLH